MLNKDGKACHLESKQKIIAVLKIYTYQLSTVGGLIKVLKRHLSVLVMTMVIEPKLTKAYCNTGPLPSSPCGCWIQWGKLSWSWNTFSPLPSRRLDSTDMALFLQAIQSTHEAAKISYSLRWKKLLCLPERLPVKTLNCWSSSQEKKITQNNICCSRAISHMGAGTCPNANQKRRTVLYIKSHYLTCVYFLCKF